jgi:membrane associated rhomboid family serine protease
VKCGCLFLWILPHHLARPRFASVRAGGFDVGHRDQAPAETNHIGASGLVFGYLGFLLPRGIIEKSIASFLLSLVVLIAYGGLLFGVLPGQPGISWQGHLFGVVAGIIASWGFFSPSDETS